MNIVMCIVVFLMIAVLIKLCSNIPPGRRRAEMPVLTEDRLVAGNLHRIEYRFRVARQAFTIYVTPVPTDANHLHSQTGQILSRHEPRTLADAQKLTTWWIQSTTPTGTAEHQLQRSPDMVAAPA